MKRFYVTLTDRKPKGEVTHQFTIDIEDADDIQVAIDKARWLAVRQGKIKRGVSVTEFARGVEIISSNPRSNNANL